MSQECRDLQHAWNPFTAEQISSKIIERELKCSRCDTTKTQVLNIDHKRGRVDVSTLRYKYAAGYLAKGIDRASLRFQGLVSA